MHILAFLWVLFFVVVVVVHVLFLFIASKIPFLLWVLFFVVVFVVHVLSLFIAPKIPFLQKKNSSNRHR